MTERPEGTPEAVPAEPEATADPNAETDAAAIEDADVDEIDEELEGDEADEDEANAADDLEAAETDEDELGDEFENETTEPLPGEPAVAAGTATTPSVSRRRGVPPAVQRAPTQSELAVRVTDDASRFFVIAIVIVFVAILGFGLLAGNGGFFTATPVPSAAPSVSAEPSASASGSASAPATGSPAPTVSIEAPSPS